MMKPTVAMHVPVVRPYTAGFQELVGVNVLGQPQEDGNVPISSMTGFASISGQTGDSDWRWDLKSVNARGLDLRFRLPPGHDGLEPKLRAAAQAALKRGSVAISLNTKYQKTVGRISVDDEALAQAISHIVVARKQLENAGLPVAKTSAEAVLSVPGVLLSGDESDGLDPSALGPDLLRGFEAAIDALVTERRAEGARLGRVISEQVTQIESLTRDAQACAEEAVIALRERFKTQLTTLLSDTSISPERMEQEAAILASKADVREEIDRLHAHVAAARELLAMEEPIGRRLDFLTQEFNREANTLCSKSPTDALTRIGLDLKMVVDQIKEQAANVE